MKIWVWLFLAILTLAVGCAQGYYERSPAYQERGGVTMNWVKNPETEEQYQNRLWSEEAGH